MTDYLSKRLTILLHTKRLRYEPRREEHKLFVTQTPTTLKMLLLRTTAQTLSNAILMLDRTTAPTTHTPLQPLYFT